MQRIPGGPLVVVSVGVGRCAVGGDFAVAVAGQRQEHRRPERLAVRRGVDLPDGARADLAAGQVGSVLAAAGRAVPPCGLLAGIGVAADPGAGELMVEFADQRIKLSSVLAVVLDVVVELLRISALFQQPGLPVVRRGGLDDGFVFEVPAFPALSGPQAPGSFRAGRAHRGEGRAAGD